MTCPRGFGLMQRARKSGDYNDLVAHYERRPSLWVEPGDWGQGAVMLVEIPTDKEINDNIVAFWRPPRPAGRRSEHRLTTACTGARPPRRCAMWPPCWIRKSARAPSKKAMSRPLILPITQILAGDPTGITLHISTNIGSVSTGQLQRNPETGGLRLTFGFDPKDAPAQELRAQLLRAGKVASEVWLYRWTA